MEKSVCVLVCLLEPGSITQRWCTGAVSGLNPAAVYLDVLVLGQARGNAGEGVVVEVQLAQVGDVGQRAVLNGADLVVAQTQSAEKQNIR